MSNQFIWHMVPLNIEIKLCRANVPAGCDPGELLAGRGFSTTMTRKDPTAPVFPAVLLSQLQRVKAQAGSSACRR